MKIAWTTVGSAHAAEELARDVVERGLAVCVQVEGPVRSLYRWKGRLEQAEEHRLCLKCRDEDAAALEAAVLARHPYDTPEWIVVGAERVGEKYLSWARGSRNP